MIIDCSSSVADIVAATAAVLTFFLGLGSAIFAFKQWKKSMQINQSKAVYAMTHDLFNDKEVCQMLYSIDHKAPDFSVKDREREITMDKILVFFDHLCWMEEKEIIDMDKHVLLYWKNRVVQNAAVRSYWSKQKNMLGETMPYYNLRKFIDGDV